MATVKGKTLFLTTSPRTIEKIVPEIALLINHFDGCIWDHDTQQAYMQLLKDEGCFEGEGKKDPAFSARDRINRTPKSLGFVCLSPVVCLTPAGQALLASKRQEEVFLRQMLKFQVPSPYHKPTKTAAKFNIKPYLEMLRLVRDFGSLKFDELWLFGMQLTDWHDYEVIKHKIERFRQAKATKKGNYKKFRKEYLQQELRLLFEEEIAKGKTHTRGSKDLSEDKFLTTKGNNMRDYADACCRYLRATGLVSISHLGKSLSIIPERKPDVEFILQNIQRDAIYVNDLAAYEHYLHDATTPTLLTDDRYQLMDKIRELAPDYMIKPSESLEQLRDELDTLLETRKSETILQQVKDIKDNKLYEDIQNLFEQICQKDTVYDAPLMLEWNTWRAMTMIDGGDIKANLKFDDFGQPMATALGNMPDILCDYGDFHVAVEVTMQTGKRQFETEGEPVMRHAGQLNNKNNKPCYCLFLAPKINPTCIPFFYTMQCCNLEIYGGRLTIIPMTIDVFMKMVEDAHLADYRPEPQQVKRLFERSAELVMECNNEKEWYEKITDYAIHWLA